MKNVYLQWEVGNLVWYIVYILNINKIKIIITVHGLKSLVTSDINNVSTKTKQTESFDTAFC